MFLFKVQFKKVVRALSFVMLSISIFPLPAQARVFDDVEVKRTMDGYEIKIDFLLPLQLQGHTPQEPGSNFYILLKTVNFQNLTSSDVDALRERTGLPWDPESPIPLEDMIYDGSNPERPQIKLGFNQDVELDAHASADLLSLIIDVKLQEEPMPAETVEETPVEEEKEVVQALPKIVVPDDEALASLMHDARESLALGEYNRAILLYTKILLKADGAARQQSQEFLGLAYERNKQLAHAKAEYDKYLQDYPQGPDADRVRQRLAGIVTAAKAPQAPLKQARRTPIEFAPGTKKKWNSQFFGSFSQFYNRDQTTPEGGTTQVSRHNLASDLDLSAKLRSPEYDINSRFSGGRLFTFIKDDKHVTTLSNLSVDVKAKEKGLYTRIGRQSLTSGGVLGRFDGVHASSQLNSFMKINGVFGFPVESSKNTTVKTEKKFYGANIDWGPFLTSWNFNTFMINQSNEGLIDRRAVGGEARYFDPQRALYTLMDYDIYFNQINIFLLNGHRTLPSKTTFSLVLDYRKSPLLTTNNAILGQGVLSIKDIKDQFSKSELKQLAKDRTTNSKSVTAGVSQDLNPNLQLTAEVTASTIEGTLSTGAVEGTEENRPDYFYSTQLIASNFLKENDVFLTTLGFNDTLSNNTYSISFDERFPFSRMLHVIPKFRFDFRDNKQTSGSRMTFRPILHLDYDFNRSMRLELEGGCEWVYDRTGGFRQNSLESFITSGYRYSF